MRALLGLACAAAVLALLPAPASAALLAAAAGGCPEVALTFDLCPVDAAPGFDAELVALLEQTATPATFFISGRWLERHEAEARRLARVPFFEIGSHGYAHAHLTALDAAGQRAEIERAAVLLRSRLAVKARLFRPPYGEYDLLTEELLEDLGLRGIRWSVVSGDPDPELTEARILERVARRIRAGSIVVFHANGKGLHTREVVQVLLERILPDQGLRPVTVTELLSCRAGTP